METRVFQVVRLCEPTSTGCSQWATSLLYSLCIIFWMITMCCKVSYLYIGLLTQLSYLTYVGFLNTFIFGYVRKDILRLHWCLNQVSCDKMKSNPLYLNTCIVPKYYNLNMFINFSLSLSLSIYIYIYIYTI